MRGRGQILLARTGKHMHFCGARSRRTAARQGGRFFLPSLRRQGMSRFLYPALAVCLAASFTACADDVTSPGLSAPRSVDLAVNTGREEVVGGEVLVRTVEGVSPETVGRAHGLAFGEFGYGKAFAILRGAAGSEHANARALKADPRVVYAEPNYRSEERRVGKG